MRMPHLPGQPPGALALLTSLLLVACKSPAPSPSSEPAASTPAPAVASSAAPAPTATGPCGEFQALVDRTYGFRPSQLEGEKRKEKVAQMDEFWKQTRERQEAWLPCLRAAISDPRSDGFFRYDASNLLRSLDRSDDARRLQLQALRAVDLGDVQLRSWVEELARLGHDGLDTSPAAVRWFDLPNPTYPLPEHATVAGPSVGALVLFGSMEDAYNAPALGRVVKQSRTPWAEKVAIELLAQLRTPGSDAELQRLARLKNTSAAQAYQQLMTGADHLKPRATPKVKRERLVQALEGLARGEEKEWSKLLKEVPDVEQDAVAVLKPADVELLRKVRRRLALGGQKTGIELFGRLSAVLSTLVGPPR